AWRAWAFRGASQPWQGGVSPRQDTRHSRSRKISTPGNILQGLIGSWLVPRNGGTETAPQKRQQLKTAAASAESWTEEGEWHVKLMGPLPDMRITRTPEEEAFWPTYESNDNPSITDETGATLTRRKYDRIESCTLEELHITRRSERLYTMGIPFSTETGHSQPKLRRWGIAILTSIPTLTVGSTLRVGTVATLRHPPELRNNYTWIIINAHRIRGVSSTSPEESTFELEQQPNGVHWMTSESTQADVTTKADIVKLQQHEYTGASVFQAHPMLHGYPWTVPDSTANRHVLAAIKKQAFKRYCGDGIKLDATVNHLQQAVQTSTWQAAAMTQSPKQLWAHTNELTAYQVWVSYRVTLRQLNLY
ncbi:hypothetical protein F443_07523, partial [Phytophthora nicotianae P1569]